MRDLRTEELSQVYGAGGKSKNCRKPPKRKCKGGRGSGSGGRGSGSGGRGSGSGRKGGSS